MADDNHATMTLPMDLIKPAIEAKVNAAVIEALGKQDYLIMRVVEQIMNQGVDCEGKANGYNGEKRPWLTWAVEQATKKAIQEAISAHLATNAEKIKDAIDAEMRKSKSPLVQSLISAMSAGLAKAVSDKYAVTVVFKE